MNIFSEIYGAYFRTVGQILQRESIDPKEVYEIISSQAFRDSSLFIPAKLLPDKNDESNWGLLSLESNGRYSRVTKNAPSSIVTEIQKRWLKSKLADKKFCLFMSGETLQTLEKRLSDVKPLYSPSSFKYYDRYSDGDDFADELYRNNFQTVLAAIKSNEIVKIGFVSRRGNEHFDYYAPLKIEYSPKNDKFRVHCIHIMKGGQSESSIINVGRIKNIENTHKYYSEKVDTKDFFGQMRCDSPAVIEVSDERNGIERFMVEFASCEKRAEFDAKTKKCTVELWYSKQDETEILVRLLGFGPVIKILGPEEFRAQARERVIKQYDLLNANTEK